MLASKSSRDRRSNNFVILPPVRVPCLIILNIKDNLNASAEHHCKIYVALYIASKCNTEQVQSRMPKTKQRTISDADADAVFGETKLSEKLPKIGNKIFGNRIFAKTNSNANKI